MLYDMYATIDMTLERPTRFGRSVIRKTINATKDVLKDEINNFIFERQGRENFIKVLKFDVRILNYKRKVVESWSYSPTYS